MSDRELGLCALSFVGGGAAGTLLTAWLARREWLRLCDALRAALADDE